MKLINRILIAVVSLAAIISLQYYYAVEAPSRLEYLEDIISSIDEHDGLEFATEVKIEKIEDDRLFVRGTNVNFFMEGCGGINEGDFGEFYMKVDKGKIICLDYTLYPKHVIEYVVSVIGVIITFIILFKEFKSSRGGFEYA